MPIPTPRSSENQSQFVSRCIGDLAGAGDFSDQKQRAAVCYSKWKEHVKKSIDDAVEKTISKTIGK